MRFSNEEYKLLTAYLGFPITSIQRGTMCPDSPLAEKGLVLFTGEPIHFFGYNHTRIGQGSYGTVWSTTSNFAAKNTRKTLSTIKEIAILNYINHPNIMCTSGAYSGLDSFTFYMPLANISLISNTFISELKKNVDERKNAYYQIFNGLAYLHSLYIIHSDIKPDNILVFKKENKYIYKIVDFGLSITCSYLNLDRIIKGTPQWRAPESFKYEYDKAVVGKFTFAIDIWAMGVIIYDIIYQETSDTFLFIGKKDENTLLKLMTQPLLYYTELNKRVYTAINSNTFNRTDLTTPFAPFEKELADLCLQKEPTERPTALECLKHKFFDDKIKPEDLKIITDGDQNVPNDSIIKQIIGREDIIKLFLDKTEKIYGTDNRKYYVTIYAARLFDIYFSIKEPNVDFNNFVNKISVYKGEQSVISAQLNLSDNKQVNDVLENIFESYDKGFEKLKQLAVDKKFVQFAQSFNLIYNYDTRVNKFDFIKPIVEDLYTGIKNIKNKREYWDRLYIINDLIEDYLGANLIIMNLLQLALLFVDEDIFLFSPMLAKDIDPHEKIVKVLDTLGDDIFTPTALQYYFSKHNAIPDAQKIYEKILKNPFQKQLVDSMTL